MTEEARVFYADIKEKKSIKNSARKKNRTGKGPIRFPSDYMTKKEKEAMNGECKSWNRMLNIYDVGIITISRVVFDSKYDILRHYLTSHTDISKYVNMPSRGGRRNKEHVTVFENAVKEWRDIQATKSETPVATEDPSESEIASDTMDMVAKYVPDISEPVEEKKPDNHFYGEDSLRKCILNCLAKKHTGHTRGEIRLLSRELEKAYKSGRAYDVSDFYPSVLAFALNSTHGAGECHRLVDLMHFKSDGEAVETVKINPEEVIESTSVTEVPETDIPHSGRYPWESDNVLLYGFNPAELPKMSHMEFGMDGFDIDFLRMIAQRFGDQKIRVCVSVYVEKSVDE